jgi:hypothetical protein
MSGDAIVPMPAASSASPNSQINNLEKFIRTKVAGTAREEKITSFCIAIADPSVSGGGIPLDTKRVTQKELDDEEFAETLATYFHDCAMQDVLTRSSFQRYIVVAYTGKETVVATHPFALWPPPNRQMMAGESESPTQTGLTAMAMRWGDMSLRLAFQQVTENANRLQAENAKLHELIDVHNQRRIEMWDKMEALRSQQHERDLQSMQAKNHEARVERFYQHAEKLLPLVAEKWGFNIQALGATATMISPPSDPQKDPVRAMLYFYTTLSQEQTKTIVDCMTDEQRTMFIAIMRGFAALSAEKEKSAA